MLAGGTSAAASYSLPGDPLYPIKINVNEKIESVLAFGTSASAKIEAKHADKRLREAEELSAKGTLDTEVAGKIKNNFNKHAERVEVLVSKLKTKGDLEDADSINSEFESALRVHQIVLVELAKDHDDDKNEINEINDDVDIRLGSTKKIRSDREKSIISSSDKMSVETATQGALSAAINKITEVEKYINSQNINSELEIKAREELEKSKKMIVEGEIKINQEAYGEAFILFHKAIRNAQEAKLILKSENNLKIRIENRLNSDDENEDTDRRNRGEDNDKDTEQEEKDDLSEERVEIESNSEIELEDEEDNEDEIEIEDDSSVNIDLD
jgi:hypothetical protein